MTASWVILLLWMKTQTQRSQITVWSTRRGELTYCFCQESSRWAKKYHPAGCPVAQRQQLSVKAWKQKKVPEKGSVVEEILGDKNVVSGAGEGRSWKSGERGVRGYHWKQNLPLTQKILPQKLKRNKRLYYWISIKPECGPRYRQFTRDGKDGKKCIDKYIQLAYMVSR